jgi:hypothetical protein
VKKGVGYITVEEADKNTKMSTDDLIPFNRNEIRGRVSQGTGIYQSSSTRPSSSASSSSEISSGGIALGGGKNKDESNLLNMST